MGDGFSDARREERQAREYQAKIDAFFDAVIDYLGMNRKHYTIQGICRMVEEYDAFVFARPYSKAAERHPSRVREWMTRIEAVKSNDAKAWAELLTEALMKASADRTAHLHELSNFSGKPFIVIVPSGTYRAPGLLGGYRQVHELLAAGNIAFAHTVRMPERAVKGMRQTDDGWEESREAGWDDVRFISF